MKTIKIFLASSEELKPERLVIAELVTKLNYIWAEFYISIRLVKWEYLDSSMGAQHKQEDYNDHLRQCDMCVVLYWTKFGMYTEIELETAYQLLNSDSCLKHMCVIFKEGGNMTDGLKSFRNKYETEHPELCNSFQIESQLKELIYQKKRDYKCPKGTIANAMSDNAVYRLPCGRWQQAGAPQRVMKLLGRLRSELKL